MNCIVCDLPTNTEGVEKPFCEACFEVFKMGLAVFSRYVREHPRSGQTKFVLAKDVLALIWEER